MPVWNRRPIEAVPARFLHTRNKFSTTESDKGLVLETEERYTEAHMTLELVPWNKHRMKTRRDLVNFWNAYRMWDAQLGRHRYGIMPLLYLRRPLSALDEAQFGVLTCKPLQIHYSC
ncbi:hypothetical protein N7455_012588 [Penicillium solitum]|uniref:uncharacterized protein n=1 Tax=Penicillium solitum TaxID=60172 RepID=UPI0032C4A39B|nr:hypothetical protein N7455_012588 [Penicillium solitum]